MKKKKENKYWDFLNVDARKFSKFWRSLRIWDRYKKDNLDFTLKFLILSFNDNDCKADNRCLLKPSEPLKFHQVHT